MLIIVLAIIIALILFPFALALAADILTVLPFAIAGAIGVLIVGLIGVFIKIKVIDKVPEETKRKIMYTLEYLLLASAAYYICKNAPVILYAIIPIILIGLTFTFTIANNEKLAKVFSVITFVHAILMVLGLASFNMRAIGQIPSAIRANLFTVTYVVSLIGYLVYHFGNKEKWNKNTPAGWAFLWLLSFIVMIIISMLGSSFRNSFLIPLYLGACSVFGLIIVSFFPPQGMAKKE